MSDPISPHVPRPASVAHGSHHEHPERPEPPERPARPERRKRPERPTPAATTPDENATAPLPRARRAVRVLDRVVRTLLAVGLVLVGVVCFLQERELRLWETEILARILTATGVADTAVASLNNSVPAVTLSLDGAWVSLRVIPQCAIAGYLGGILLLAAILVSLPRVRILRLIAATILAAMSLILLNQFRLLVIGVMYAEGGREAFNWAHGPLGSIIMMLGVAAVLSGFFLFCVRDSRRRAPAALPRGTAHGAEPTRGQAPRQPEQFRASFDAAPDPDPDPDPRPDAALTPAPAPAPAPATAGDPTAPAPAAAVGPTAPDTKGTPA